MIAEADLPIHYRRSQILEDSQEIYGQMLTNILGYDNPHNVSYLSNMLGLSEEAPPSLMRGLQRLVMGFMMSYVREVFQPVLR